MMFWSLGWKPQLKSLGIPQRHVVLSRQIGIFITWNITEPVAPRLPPSFFPFMCVLYVHMCAGVGECSHGGVYMCGGQRITSASFFRHYLPRIFFSDNLSLVWNSPSRLDWLTKEPQAACSTLLALRLQVHATTPNFSYMGPCACKASTSLTSLSPESPPSLLSMCILQSRERDWCTCILIPSVAIQLNWVRESQINGAKTNGGRHHLKQQAIKKRTMNLSDLSKADLGLDPH